MSCSYPIPSRTRWTSRSPAGSHHEDEPFDKEGPSHFNGENAPLSIPVPPTGRISAASNYTQTTTASTFRPHHRRHKSAYATFNQSTDNLCPGVGSLRGGFCFPVRHTRDSAAVKATMRTAPVVPMMDFREFDALPPAVRRKVRVKLFFFSFFTSHITPYGIQSVAYLAMVAPQSAGIIRPPTHLFHSPCSA